MVKVKICGITTQREVSFLNELSPEYIGFVFAKSKRQISVEKGIQLSNNTSEYIKKVAVFRNNNIEEIKNIIENVSIDVIQLHGNENEKFIDNVRKLSDRVEIWKAISAEKSIDNINLKCNKVLLDAINPGEGKRFEWTNFNREIINKPFFLAGGINDENVNLGINIFKPFGVDVSTGVESINEYGIREKNYIKTKKLIEKVRNYNEG